MNARMCQQSAANRLRLVQTHSAEIRSDHALDAVVFCEALVEHGPIGVDEIGERQIASKHLRYEMLCLAAHGGFEFGIVFRIKIRVRLHHTDLAHAQPLAGEVLEKAPAARIRQHALGLGTANGRIEQTAIRRSFQQFVIWRRSPEKIGHPRCNGEGVGTVRRLFVVEESR